MRRATLGGLALVRRTPANNSLSSLSRLSSPRYYSTYAGEPRYDNILSHILLFYFLFISRIKIGYFIK